MTPVAQKRLHKWVCCVGWPAQVDTIVRVTLQRFYEESQIFNWPPGSARSLSQHAHQCLVELVQAVASMQGHALMPAMEPLGLRVPLYFIYSDAAKDPDGSPHEFRGFGLFFFKAGSSVLFAQKGRWTHHEEKFLEIDTLELVAGNIALLALVDSLRSAGFVFTPKNAPAQQWSLDICQVFDNASVGTHIANSNKASGATRHAVCTRARVLSDHRIRAHSEHSVRETALASMADDLSKGGIASFEATAKRIFGPSLSVIYLEDLAAGDSRRDLSGELRLATRKSERTKSSSEKVQQVTPPDHHPDASTQTGSEESLPIDHWPAPASRFPPDSALAHGRHATRKLFAQRRANGRLRPSETERMHVLPFMIAETWIFPQTPKLSHPNNRIAAAATDVIAHPDVRLCAPADTTPPSAHEAKEWIAAQTLLLHQERLEYERRRSEFNGRGFVHPLSVTRRWPEILQWCSAYLAEIGRCEANPKARFNYANLPGGKDGIRIPESDIAEWCHGLFLEVQGPAGPVVARGWVDPQANTELRLDRIWEYVLDTLDSDDPFPDLQIAFELCFRGLSNRSDVRPRGIVLAPNYRKLWLHPWLQTAQKKLQAKHAEFEPPRVSAPSKFLHRIPGAIAVANMATDQLDVEGNVKPRLTLDHGFGGRPGQLPPGEIDPSINGNTPQDDLQRFPPIEYLRMERYAKACAILLEANEPIAQSAEDCESYYEQLPREWREAHYQLLCMESAGFREDTRLEFGVAAECHTSNRISFLFTWIRQRETRAQQLRAEQLPVAGATPRVQS